MSHAPSPELRDLIEPGWREREAARKQAFADFFASLPNQPTRIGAAVIVNRTQTTATVEPIAVVDFYPEPKDSDVDH